MANTTESAETTCAFLVTKGKWTFRCYIPLDMKQSDSRSNVDVMKLLMSKHVTITKRASLSELNSIISASRTKAPEFLVQYDSNHKSEYDHFRSYLVTRKRAGVAILSPEYWLIFIPEDIDQLKCMIVKRSSPMDYTPPSSQTDSCSKFNTTTPPQDHSTSSISPRIMVQGQEVVNSAQVLRHQSTSTKAVAPAVAYIPPPAYHVAPQPVPMPHSQGQTTPPINISRTPVYQRPVDPRGIPKPNPHVSMNPLTPSSASIPPPPVNNPTTLETPTTSTESISGAMLIPETNTAIKKEFPSSVIGVGDNAPAIVTGQWDELLRVHNCFHAALYLVHAKRSESMEESSAKRIKI